MPTYEYACTSCGQRVEVVQSFSDDPLTECEACGAPLRKVFAPVGIVLKGSGFYKNDSRAGRSGTKAKDSSGGDSSDTPSTEKKATPATSSGPTGDGGGKDAKTSTNGSSGTGTTTPASSGTAAG